jgi:Mn-dependent DtxR family transcriptional regulator
MGAMYKILLVNDQARQVFEKIAEKRYVRLKDLRDMLGQDPAAITHLNENLNSLKQARLIDEEGASLEDFTTYYVTSDGLSAERQLRRSR